MDTKDNGNGKGQNPNIGLGEGENEIQGNGQRKEDTQRNYAQTTNEKENISNSNESEVIVKDKKKSLVSKYIVTTLMIVVTIIAIATVTVFGLVFVYGRKNSSKEESSPIDITVDDNNEDSQGGFWENVIKAPRKTNILLLGLDKTSMLSDVVIVASFDSVTKYVDVVSLPRDTYVTLTKEEIKDLNDNGKYPPTSMKLNELHSYAGKELGHKYSKSMAEKILGIEIDYYAEIDLEAFRDIVDAVGGIYMDIPKGGLYYNDPYQNLSIAIPQGNQLLTGEQAEGVVRFRDTYRRGDIERIDVQKAFMKEFFVQVINKDTIMSNLVSFAGSILNYVKTDFGVTDIPQYLTSLDGISGEKIRFYTLPGEPRNMNGGSYYVYDDLETANLMEGTILDYGVGTSDKDNQNKKTIQLLNGSYRSTIATKIKNELEDEGYNVIDGGDYIGEKTVKTRILADDVSAGERLIELFSNAEVDTDSSQTGEYDFVIILGQSE